MQRVWNAVKKTTSGGFSKSPSTFKPFRVLSFNTLAHSLVDSRYDSHDRNVMSWATRRYAILREILNQSPDIVALQEIDDCCMSSFFQQELGKFGYSGVYEKKNGSSSDGIATFWKEARFKIHRKKRVELSTQKKEFMQRNQVGLLVLLEDTFSSNVGGHNRDTGRPFCLRADKLLDLYIIANTHLIFNWARGDVKLCQLCILLNEIVEFYELSRRMYFDNLINYYSMDYDQIRNICPSIIFCGDFNITPQSPLYAFMNGHSIDFYPLDYRKLSGQFLMHRSLYMACNFGHMERGSSTTWREELISRLGLWLEKRTSTSRHWILDVSEVIDVKLFMQHDAYEKFKVYLDHEKASNAESLNQSSSNVQPTDSLSADVSSQGNAMTDSSSHVSSALPYSHSTLDTTASCFASSLAAAPGSFNISASKVNTTFPSFELTMPIKFSSAYSTVSRDGWYINSLVNVEQQFEERREPFCTSFHGWQRGCIDYIWHSSDQLEVLQIFEMPDIREIFSHGDIPHIMWPSSDHFSLIVDFVKKDERCF